MPSASGRSALRRRGNISNVRALVNFLRANPQVLILLVICLVLGLGTFIAVLISLAQNSNGSLQGEPSGLVLVAVRALA